MRIGPPPSTNATFPNLGPRPGPRGTRPSWSPRQPVHADDAAIGPEYLVHNGGRLVRASESALRLHNDLSPEAEPVRKPGQQTSVLCLATSSVSAELTR